ncbi:hypothetical protein EPI10_014950 [Gossypium australe]|uniref:Uncharacterized protein n=1 Tax=Gossypium australe TaxID=47621 RepID=A0A5B6VIM2_9ROSI|nr:hypothetical protein EPI10_014950 [Gossypium australe]
METYYEPKFIIGKSSFKNKCILHMEEYMGDEESASGRNVLSHPIDNCTLVYVVGLIDSNRREWKEKLISNTFNEVNVGRILRIPLAAIPQEDEVA